MAGMSMDGNKFPNQLFPSFYNTGPLNRKANNAAVGSLGLYNQAFVVGRCLSKNGPVQLADWEFDTQYKVKGETWKTVEPIPIPLMAQNKAHRTVSGHVPSASDFPEHMQQFYLENYEDAFSTMSSVLGEHFNFGERRMTASVKKKTVRMNKLEHFLSTVNHIQCPIGHYGKGAKRYNNLLGDVIHEIPPQLLAELLQEELLLQNERVQFNEVATGGALGYFPVKLSDSSQKGCLVFPEETSLRFHKVALEFDRDKVPRLSMSNTQPLVMGLNGAVRQISVGAMHDSVHIGVRSDYHCGVWLACPGKSVRPLEVVQTEQVATCICVSPHIPGELLVTTENGTAYLWTVGAGLSKIREEENNLYFNAQSSWRWCDFSGHPKVMQYTDRTGVELTDTRASVTRNYTLFRIGETPDCKSGERVILSKYLHDVNAYHHLVTTQNSAYIMDERFPCLPMLKWDHMMVDPPLFAQVLPGSPRGRTNKILLGSQRSQELMFLQYSGGGEAACRSLGPHLKLSRPADSLGHVRALVPHEQQEARERLLQPAAGLIAIHLEAEDCLCVLQLSETGDVFYQTLMLQTDQDSAETQPPRTSTGADEERGVTTKVKNSLHSSRQSSGDASSSKGVGTSCGEMEVNNDDEDLATVSNTEMQDTDERSVTQTGSSLRRDPTKPRTVSQEVLSKWEWWLRALFEGPRTTSEQIMSHRTVETEGLISCKALRRDPVEEDQLQRLRKDLEHSMNNRDVVVHGVTYLRPLEVVPLPDPVVPADWTDDLSERLSVSWGGHWKAWWEDKLGMNHLEKVAALRRKRQRQKRARAHRRVALSESFASSASYRSDLDDLSGWSSQGAYSDAESVTTNFSVPDSFLEPERGNVLTQPDGPLGREDDRSAQLKLASRRTKRLEQDYLSSLFGSQGQEESHESGLGQLMMPFSQGSSFSSSQRNPCVGTPAKAPQSTQPKKKRPKMGF